MVLIIFLEIASRGLIFLLRMEKVLFRMEKAKTRNRYSDSFIFRTFCALVALSEIGRMDGSSNL